MPRLLLTAGQLGGEEGFFPDDLERSRISATMAWRSDDLDILVDEWRLDVFVDRELIDEMICLEDEADVLFVQL